MGLGPVPTPAPEVLVAVVATVVQPPPFHTSGGGLPPLDDALLGPLLNGGEWMVSLWVITGSM